MDDKVSIWLSEEIKRRGMSIRELARRCKVSHTVITDMINLGHKPRVEVYRSIARVLEVDEKWLLELAGILPASPPTDETSLAGRQLEAIVYC